MPTYLIPLDTAVSWTTDFREVNPERTKAYRIDRAELEQILAIEGTGYVRAYFGLDGTEEKLILVPVDSDGRDIINTDPERDSNVYDFTLPCPSICDLDSPLNS